MKAYPEGSQNMAMSIAKKADMARDKKLGIKEGSKKDKKKDKKKGIKD